MARTFHNEARQRIDTLMMDLRNLQIDMPAHWVNVDRALLQALDALNYADTCLKNDQKHARDLMRLGMAAERLAKAEQKEGE